ncbi:hypothetical protein ERO13_A02G033501v2 [Gossypium hirsutum]|uniref:N-acetyltransferase domain-containing protein n=2 Tax=Gossypium TaxID=3633 RepID=A0A5D3A1A3_GOSMU|nr:hypothetical protein ERO13_A02G033501v2 [Gossypium hirsutum]TYH27081.1 hypothetical protein ES288_A02G040700v1 [Gossypium darwinii]TYJ45195.1 hypothetical protein E1A91_A02G039200v1 [Gossypium mustelinum]
MEVTSVVQLDQTKAKDEYPNLSLRPLQVSDVDDFMVWASDEKNYIKNIVVPHPWLRAICIDDRPVGAISVSANSGNDKCRGELGYVLASKYWGKGIVTRAVKMVVDTIFVEWPHLERLEALVDVENVGSQRELEKAGFQREGVLRKYFIVKGRSRDRVMFSFLSTDYQS